MVCKGSMSASPRCSKLRSVTFSLHIKNPDEHIKTAQVQRIKVKDQAVVAISVVAKAIANFSITMAVLVIA